MGRRTAAPAIDTRPLILRLGLMALGVVLLVTGALTTLLVIGVFISNWSTNFESVDYSTDTSAGGAILGIAVVCVMVAWAGWGILLHGRYVPRKTYRLGKRRRNGGDGSGGDGSGAGYSRDGDGDSSGDGGGGDGGGGGGGD